MELNVIEQDDTKLIIEVMGGDHTLLNAVVKTMQNDKQVVTAAYTMEHPLNPKPRLLIETKKGVDAKKILKAAIDATSKEYDAFQKEFKKAFA